MGLGSFFKGLFSSTKFKKRDFDPSKFSIKDVVLPKILEDLDVDIIKSMVKEEIATYKSLGYTNKPVRALEKTEYHSFQIGVIIRYIKLNIDLFVPAKEKVFPSFILDYSSKQLHNRVLEIVKTYKKEVDVNQTGARLTREVVWTPLDATFLLYYLATYHD